MIKLLKLERMLGYRRQGRCSHSFLRFLHCSSCAIAPCYSSLLLFPLFSSLPIFTLYTPPRSFRSPNKPWLDYGRNNNNGLTWYVHPLPLSPLWKLFPLTTPSQDANSETPYPASKSHSSISSKVSPTPSHTTNPSITCHFNSIHCPQIPGPGVLTSH